MRGSAAGAEVLASLLRQASPGTARPLWDVLPSLPIPSQFVAGELDAKFATLATKMASAMNPTTLEQADKLHRNNRNPAKSAAAHESGEPKFRGKGAVIIEGCGHAVHTEQPQALVPVIRSFVQAIDRVH